ncbi:MAG: nitronate monooxygenase [Candidatus Sericytochromatia bacterium]|nr:nitronate monooxygenase [Candidatus Sericytochromatia bacterium]
MTVELPPTTRLTRLLGIRVPIIQAGMIWVSGAKLAAAVSEAGGLGVLGAGSMRPEVFREQVTKLKTLTLKPWAVNLPVFYKHIDDIVPIALAEGCRIFITSAGNPARWTPRLKDAGALVIHVVATARQAEKCEALGCDAVVAEGFEAGGHNGPDELTTMVLVPQVVRSVSLPVVAAGGIVDGATMLAALALGAAGVQVGTRFACTRESSAHEHYKQAIVAAGETDTVLALKSLMPVRLLKNAFWEQVRQAEARGASAEELQALLGSGRPRRAIHLGELAEGEIEVGQAVGAIRDIPAAGAVLERMMDEARLILGGLCPRG